MGGAAEQSGTRVVVGVDGSTGARVALVWAMTDAARRGARLQVVSTFPVEAYWADPNLIDERRVDAVRADTEVRVRALIEEVRSESGDGPAQVDVVVLPGAAARQLLAAAEGADLLVVGSRGRGPVRSTVLGSVALHTVTHARCPVVVVHPRAAAASARPRVVVGLDGSEGSREALARALTEAGGLGAEVAAVAAFSATSYWSDSYVVVIPPPAQMQEDTRRAAEAMVADVVPARSTVAVRTTAVEGPAGDVLVGESEGAGLLVVGSRGLGAIRGMLLGSIALHCVVHARCPVMVVPPDRTGEQPD
ncbi:universal stress protein [Blastococcus sp. CT_GayMR16]|uniref:universal stress protein n=1 Tax=Blastococcus sp. CT_GayMR16 TaxID=2559607 RepID=UPI001430804A|nr:universal stress protein [Blastococcus sp. CT_GayMR16]